MLRWLLSKLPRAAPLAASRLRVVPVEPVLQLSGPAWVGMFPTGRTTASLVQPFRAHVQAFIGALEASGIFVRISATRRPIERAHLMHYAWDIANGLIQPELVPARAGVPIQWVHATPEASRAAAQAMVLAYDLAVRPSLTSRHIGGRAVDMAIVGWENHVVINGQGVRVRLQTLEDLCALGASFGVHKLRSDPPHWSDDGH